MRISELIIGDAGASVECKERKLHIWWCCCCRRCWSAEFMPLPRPARPPTLAFLPLSTGAVLPGPRTPARCESRTGRGTHGGSAVARRRGRHTATAWSIPSSNTRRERSDLSAWRASDGEQAATSERRFAYSRGGYDGRERAWRSCVEPWKGVAAVVRS